jgi:hypothetical protein
VFFLKLQNVLCIPTGRSQDYTTTYVSDGKDWNTIVKDRLPQSRALTRHSLEIRQTNSKTAVTEATH